MGSEPLAVAIATAGRAKARWAESWALCRESRELTEGARARISRSREILYDRRPRTIRGGSSIADETLRRRVVLGLMSGVLFPVTSKSWVGPGTGKICVVCDQGIDQTDIEHEVDGPNGPVAAHQACYAIWQQESEVRRRLK